MKYVGLSLLINQTLILGDLHLGHDEAYQKQGIFLPKFHYKDLASELKLVLDKVKPKVVVINGDLKHEFGKITDDEWKETLALLDLISKNCELVIIKGNHDSVLEPILKKRNLSMKDYYYFEGNYVYHGHYMPEDMDFHSAKRIVISHDHPAITLKEGPRVEKYKCFLKGTYNGKELVVLPAFSPSSPGTDVFKEKMMSPLLSNIEDFEVIVAQDGGLNFGKLKDLR